MSHDAADSHAPRAQSGSVQEALGQSEAFVQFQEDLSRAARVDRPILIVGERGTGKELAAARLHFLSKRWQEPFVALNCAALQPTLIESELFGHEAGAFTGANRRRTGRFEAADTGTLFLDEIALIPVQTQEKILRVVEYGTFERVGSSEPVRVDVRIIGATNSDLVTLADEGQFMADLLDRLSFEVLFLPPLRARPDDILLLANHFAARMAYELGWPQLPEIVEEAADRLLEYSWPGNVRELKNVIERAVYRSDDAVITAEEIVLDPFESQYAPEPRRRAFRAVADRDDVDEAAPDLAGAGDAGELALPFQEAVRAFEIRHLRRALEQAKFNQRKAADLLGLSYHQFRGLYRKYSEELAE